jgi:hypothetical protein
MIRTSHSPAPLCQRPTRRDVARRLGAFLAASLAAVLFAFPGVARADPPDSAFAEGVLKDANLGVLRKYRNAKLADLKSYPEHKADDPWVDAGTAKVFHKVDHFTKVPAPLKAWVIWSGKSKEGIPYYVRAEVDLRSDGKVEGSNVLAILFGDEAEKAGKEADAKWAHHE